MKQMNWSSFKIYFTTLQLHSQVLFAREEQLTEVAGDGEDYG